MPPTSAGITHWHITKRLHGILEGFIVEDTMWQDARLPRPFTPGKRVRACAGSDYTVLACYPERLGRG